MLIRSSFVKHLAQTSDAPLGIQVESAKGVFLYGPDDERWLDLIAGISVSSLGHGHPQVLSAIKQQVDSYMHTMVYGELIQAPQVKLAEWLAMNLPDPLDSSFFVNSGSEATEGALKLAKRATGRSEIFAFRNSYHGSSHGALSVMGGEFWKQGFRPLLPGIHFLDLNVEEQLEALDGRAACIILETIQGEAGVQVPHKSYMQALRKKCDKHGILLILDEIQAGCGRTGKLWAFEHYGIVPDILLLSKAFGGGMPLGAFISSRELMSVLQKDPPLGHISTFGGHPVCCAASLAALKFITEEGLIDRVEEIEMLLHKQLKDLPGLVEIRSKGLLMALEFGDETLNQRLISRCLELGVMSDWFLWSASSMRIAPPLIISNEEVGMACEVIQQAAEETVGS
jgi:acetylornithine/succinyldiaminopimelate/putrescine aminotransferase